MTMSYEPDSLHPCKTRTDWEQHVLGASCLELLSKLPNANARDEDKRGFEQKDLQQLDDMNTSWPHRKQYSEEMLGKAWPS